jgi:hypothetical protein
MSQDIYNIALGLAAFLGGWWMKVMWESLKDLQKADKELAEKVGSIEVLVAGTYIKRDDFDKVADAIFRKLDKIEDKLDGKADK